MDLSPPGIPFDLKKTRFKKVRKLKLRIAAFAWMPKSLYFFCIDKYIFERDGKHA